MMLDTILEIYKNGLSIGIIAALISMPLFFIIGIIRYTKRYAYAQPLSEDDADLTDSSFVCRILWCIEVFADGDPILEDEDIIKPIGADWQGAGLDMGLSGVFFLLLGILWPVAIPCMILWFFIQTMHNYHTKKKEFIKKLRDEETDP